MNLNPPCYAASHLAVFLQEWTGGQCGWSPEMAEGSSDSEGGEGGSGGPHGRMLTLILAAVRSH